MDIKLFDYKLPKKLIANSPVNPRDRSKLMVIDRITDKISHDNFYNLPKYLSSNDVLVFNNSKVFPARLIGNKTTSGKIEFLLLKNTSGTKWTAMYRGRLKIGDQIKVGELKTRVLAEKDGIAEIEFDIPKTQMMEKIYDVGHTPIPPYIKSETVEEKLRNEYQTVYAKIEGSSAAPTAGFHFTDALFKRLSAKGVQTEFVTLHVGPGTFASVKEHVFEHHKIHSEYFEVTPETIERLNKAKREGKRIICVGTTSLRVLETLSNKSGHLTTNNKKATTNLFIYPPYRFNFVDALITNFHLPKSTLLALVTAFVSSPNTKEKFQSFEKSSVGKAYLEAINRKYRFYSFGDASLVV